MATHKEITEQKMMVDNIAEFLTEEIGVEVESLLLLDALACYGYLFTKMTGDNIASEAFLTSLAP